MSLQEVIAIATWVDVVLAVLVWLSLTAYGVTLFHPDTEFRMTIVCIVVTMCFFLLLAAHLVTENFFGFAVGTILTTFVVTIFSFLLRCFLDLR